MSNLRQGNSVFLLGALFLLGSAIFSAGTQVYYANKVQGLDPFVFLFISFSITIIVFSGFNHFSKSSRTFQIKEGKKDLLYLNVSTAVAIITFYYALKYVEPAIVSAIEIGVGPLFALLLGKVLLSQKAPPAKWGIGLGILIGSCFLFWTSLTGRSGVELSSSFHMVVGLFASLICGFAAVYAAIYSKKLSERGWNSTTILAHRFYIIVPITMLIAFGNGSMKLFIFNDLVWIVVVTLFGVILPLFLLQLGIRVCEPFFVMISIAFIPVFTFFFQIFDTRVQWSTGTLIGILVLLTFAIVSVFVEHHSSGNTKERKQRGVG